MSDIVAFPFLQSPQYGYRGTGKPMIAISDQGCNYPYTLTWNSGCDLAVELDAKGFLDGTITEFFLDIQFNGIEYDEVLSGTEDGSGNFIKDYHSIKRRYSFDLVADNNYYDYLKFVSLFDEVKLIRVGGQEYTLENIRIEKQEDFGHEYVLSISFNVIGQSMAVVTCCPDAIAEIPFEEDCEEPAGGPDPDCLNYNVIINESGGNLIASATGQPPDCVDSFQWFYDDGNGIFQLISTGTTIAIGAFGKYKAVGQCGTCVEEDVFTYLDPCAGFEISGISFDGNSIDVNTIGCTGGGAPSIAWDFIDDMGVETPLPNTTFSIIPATTGSYRATVDCGICVDEKIIFVNIESCDWTAEIERVANQLTALVTGCAGTPDIDWTIDRGLGGPVESIDDTPTIPIDGNGLYIATITCDGCVVKVQELVIECGVQDCEITVAVVRTGDNLTANVSECNDEPVLIEWFINTGNGYGSAIGTGNTTPISTNGMYKAKYTCGTCIVEDEFLVVDCDACILAADISQSGVDLTVNITGCAGTPIIQWSFGPAGETLLPDTTATITAITEGIYFASVECDGCNVTTGFMFCGDDCGSPFDAGTGLPIEICD